MKHNEMSKMSVELFYVDIVLHMRVYESTDISNKSYELAGKGVR